MKILKIYCDTATLFHNVKRHENKTKSARELAALEELLKLRESGKCLMFRSRVVWTELERTNATEQRIKLQADYEALDQIPQDELPLGSFNITDHMGGCISNPIVSDYLDEALYRELLQRGLSDKDAHHITHAVSNKCDVFLTCDEKTIIKPHRKWLEDKFPRVKIRLPSELLAELSGAATT